MCRYWILKVPCELFGLFMSVLHPTKYLPLRPNKLMHFLPRKTLARPVMLNVGKLFLQVTMMYFYCALPSPTVNMHYCPLQLLEL